MSEGLLNQLNRELRERAEGFRTASQVEVANQTVLATVDTGYVESSLPNGITMDHVRAVQEHQLNVEAANQLSAGQLAEQHFAHDPNLQQVTSAVQYGHLTIESSVERVREIKQRGKKAPLLEYGHTVTASSINTEANQNQLSDVQKYIAQQMEMLANK